MTAADRLVERARTCTALATLAFEPDAPPAEVVDALAALWTHASSAKRASDASLRLAQKLGQLRRRGDASSVEVERKAEALEADGLLEAARDLRSQLTRYGDAVGDDLHLGETRLQAHVAEVVAQVEPFERAVGVIVLHLSALPLYAGLVSRLR